MIRAARLLLAALAVPPAAASVKRELENLARFHVKLLIVNADRSVLELRAAIGRTLRYAAR